MKEQLKRQFPRERPFLTSLPNTILKFLIWMKSTKQCLKESSLKEVEITTQFIPANTTISIIPLLDSLPQGVTKCCKNTKNIRKYRPASKGTSAIK
jgi:hypothetical protein